MITDKELVTIDGAYGLLGMAPGERARPEDFLPFLRTVPVDVLLAHRPAQAAIDTILGRYFTNNPRAYNSARDRGIPMVLSPYPTIALEKEGQWRSVFFVHEPFLLQDEQFWYYFPVGWMTDEYWPQVLRPEDVVASGQQTPHWSEETRDRLKREFGIDDELFAWLKYNVDPRVWDHVERLDIPFTKTLHRVPRTGGQAQHYNYVRGGWEDSQEGVYKPSIKERVAGLLGRPQ